MDVARANLLAFRTSRLSSVNWQMPANICFNSIYRSLTWHMTGWHTNKLINKSIYKLPNLWYLYTVSTASQTCSYSTDILAPVGNRLPPKSEEKLQNYLVFLESGTSLAWFCITPCLRSTYQSDGRGVEVSIEGRGGIQLHRGLLFAICPKGTFPALFV